MAGDDSFSLGIEEEYLLVDRETRDLVREAPPGFLSSCERRIGSQVAPEFMQSQIEVGTCVCRSVGQAREELRRLRSGVAEAAAEHGCAILAASTHPFARFREQLPTPRERYKLLAHDLQEVARRLVISGIYEFPIGPHKEWLNHGIGSHVIGGWSFNWTMIAQPTSP